MFFSGISNTIGRVFAGWLSDFSWVDSLLVTNFAILFSGLSTIILPFCTNYASFVTIALLFGFCVAAYISLTSIVLVDLLGLDNLTSAFGLLVLFRGVSSMVGPPVAGAVFDATQSYDFSFFMAGGFLIAASLISFSAQILQRRKLKEKSEK
jgi:MCP family monocarboxylic acid transporter-like MFS transporter 14